MSNQVQNQPTAAYWLSIIGSIIGILASISFFAFGAIAFCLSQPIRRLTTVTMTTVQRNRLGIRILLRHRRMVPHIINTRLHLRKETKSKPNRTRQMGLTHSHLLTHRLRHITRLHRRYPCNSLQTNTRRSTTTICTTATILWTTTTTSSIPAANGNHMPTMRNPSATRRTLLPQLRQTTKLNQKALNVFLGNQLFSFLTLLSSISESTASNQP